MMRILPVGCLVILAAAACTSGRPPFAPTLSVALPSNDWGDFALDVFDETGLIVGGSAGDQSLGGVNPLGVIAAPERNELSVNWTGGACSHRPILRVTGDPSDLELVIVPTPVEFSLVPETCPAIGILSSATMTLSQPIQQENVSIKEER